MTTSAERHDPSLFRAQNRAIASSFLKGLQLMGVLARRPEGLSVSLLMRKLNVPRTSVLRMLRTLEHCGLAARNGRAWCATDLFYAWSSRAGPAETPALSTPNQPSLLRS